jgi:DNA polymerase-4
MDGQREIPVLCRDRYRFAHAMPLRCPGCGGSRLVRHRSLLHLSIAYVDCDAFYASVEKRDRPDLQSQPVIIGSGTRGVVTSACYVTRIYGVKSAMPMFKALKACPDAVVIKPNFAKYVAASHQIRALMAELTPLVQPLSIDEAVLDLTGTEALHGAPAAAVLARFATVVERHVGVTVSIGLAANWLMAKLPLAVASLAASQSSTPKKPRRCWRLNPCACCLA